MKLAFLASHNGSSAKEITAACKDGRLTASPTLMISNNAESYALKWAKEQGLSTVHSQGGDADIKQALLDHDIDLVVLSGWMKLIGPETVRAFPRKILNVHPGLLPQYGGQGMYGQRVHEAVKENGDTETGITIHYVDEIYDHGEIIAQEKIPLSPNNTAEEIERKVKDAEPEFYIRTLQKIIG